MTTIKSRDRTEPPAFSRESDLVSRLIAELESDDTPWGSLDITREWDYRTGITDVLARTAQGELIAFEAKLSDWRRAIHQAYRNTVFAQRAYVVLPGKTASKAAMATELFSRHNIGLCSVEDACINILIDAPTNEVLVPWLRTRATAFFDNEPSEPEARSIQSHCCTRMRPHRCVA